VPSNNYFEQLVDEIVTVLASLPRPRNGRSDWREILFKHHSERMLADNARIWTVAGILLPISLAAFGALASIKCVRPWHVAVLGFSSVTLIGFWIIISENQRAFQEKSEAWLVAIQRTVGLNFRRQGKLARTGLGAVLVKTITIQRLRWFLFVSVITAWGAIGVASLSGHLPSSCDDDSKSGSSNACREGPPGRDGKDGRDGEPGRDGRDGAPGRDAEPRPPTASGTGAAFQGGAGSK